MVAGQDVEIALAARDSYGNAVGDLEPNAMKALAAGGDAAVNFEPYEVRLASLCSVLWCDITAFMISQNLLEAALSIGCEFMGYLVL